jgi:ribosomal protein S18 acetylase RimI-like enzyme
MDYTLRLAIEEDYQYCCRLTKKNMHDLYRRHWGGWVAAEFRNGFVLNNITMIIMAGRMAGYISVKQTPDSIYIDNIQISPAWQRHGIGSAILNRILNGSDMKSVKLTTFDDNPAKRLYERMGFSVFEREGMTIRMEKLPNKAQNRGANFPR